MSIAAQGIQIQVDTDGRVTEGNSYFGHTYWGHIRKDEVTRVNYKGQSYPTYEAFTSVKDEQDRPCPVGRYRESRHAIMAVVLGMELPSSLKG